MTLTANLLLLMTHLPTGASTTLPIVSPELLRMGECRIPVGWDDVVDQGPRYVVFGELHGTQQGPEFIGNLACALAAKKQRILVAVEKSATGDRELQTAWKLPGGKFGKALTNIGWRGREDGVASEAMFAMLVRLHDLKERGLPISVVAFNGIRTRTSRSALPICPGKARTRRRRPRILLRPPRSPTMIAYWCSSATFMLGRTESSGAARRAV